MREKVIPYFIGGFLGVFFRRGCCKLNIEIIYILLHLTFSNNTYTRRFNIFKQYLYIAGLIFSTTKFSISKWTSKWRFLDRPRMCPDKVNVLLGHSDRYTLVYVILCTIMHNHTSMPIASTHIFMPLRTTGWSWLFIDYIILPKAGFNMGGEGVVVLHFSFQQTFFLEFTYEKLNYHVITLDLDFHVLWKCFFQRCYMLGAMYIMYMYKNVANF